MDYSVTAVTFQTPIISTLIIAHFTELYIYSVSTETVYL